MNLNNTERNMLHSLLVREAGQPLEDDEVEAIMQCTRALTYNNRNRGLVLAMAYTLNQNMPNDRPNKKAV